MESFSKPQSTKRTASPPSTHPIGLQSHCSTLTGSLPLWLCRAPAPHGTTGSTPCWDPHLLPPVRHQLHVRQLHPHPTRTPTLWALLDPSSMCDCRIATPLGFPYLRPAGHQLCLKKPHLPPHQHPHVTVHTRSQPCMGSTLHWDPRSSGPARIPASWVVLGPSSTGLPDNHSTSLLLRPPQEGSKPA
jgi:hypothetical protein